MKRIADYLPGILYAFAAIVLAILVSSGIMLLIGNDPLLAFTALFDGAFGSVNSLANTLSMSIPLMFTGLAFSYAMKGGLFNIGGEGQLYIGAFASTVVALALQGAPAVIVMPLAILSGMLAGGLLGGFIGLIKVKLRVHEVIVAIMFNYIAMLLTSYFVNGPLLAEGSMTPQTERIPDAFLFTRILPRTQLTTALYLGLVVAVATYFFFKKTRIGYNIRAVGENPTAAKVSGVNITATTMLAMGLSGSVAALAGITEVFGKHDRFIDGFSPGFGFTGIAVAVLGNNNPFGIIATALLFGALNSGALRMSHAAGISSSMVMVVQGLVILFVATPAITRGIFKAVRVRRLAHGKP
ncbi:MAG: ABC transporter permease [Oscillospiraceae bacterium]|nr:ABC transporter permease [Oscillospiraceae bacterium]